MPLPFLILNSMEAADLLERNKPVVDAAVELLADAVNAYTAAFFVFDPARGTLELFSWHTLSKNLIPRCSIGAGEGVEGLVHKSGETVSIANFARDARALRYYSADEDIKAFLGTPVRGVGVLIADSKRSYSFTDRERKMLEGFSRLLARMAAVDVMPQEAPAKPRPDLARSLLKKMESSAGGLRFVALALQAGKEALKASYALLAEPSGSGRSFRITAREGAETVLLPLGEDQELSGVWALAFARREPFVFKSHLFDAAHLTRKGDADRLLAGRTSVFLPVVTGGEVTLLFAFIDCDDELASSFDRDGAVLFSQLVASRVKGAAAVSGEHAEPVSGLMHYSSFFRWLKLVCDDYRKGVRIATLFVLAIDDFASVALRYSHPAGEDLIRMVADRVRSIFGPSAYMAHMGMGVFSALLLDLPPKDEGRIVRNIELSFAPGIFSVKGIDVHMNFKLGVAVFPRDAANAEKLWKRAFRSMRELG